jgi:hypothetical protein
MSRIVAVNGLELPGALVELVDAGRWRRPGTVDELRRLTGLVDAHDLEFLGIESMELNTRALVATVEVPDDARRFRLASSRHDRRPVTDPSVLDVDLAVLIAATHGDAMLCLDYRAHPDHPTVVVSDWPGAEARWRVLSPNIETLAKQLSL